MNNAKIYGVQDKIECLVSDCLCLKRFKADVFFGSPPWGGIEYNSKEYDLTTDITPNIEKIISIGLSISPNLVLFLPRNTNIPQLGEIFSKSIISNNL